MWLLVVAVGAAALWSVFQDAAATMRNQKEMRWLITPGNVLWSTAMVLGQDSAQATRPRAVIGTDAARTAQAQAPGRKPLRVVLVVGETARAANWGLNGYSRQTTPQLAAMPDVVAFTKVSSCGTNTEVSVPCMFSPWGRRQYDEARIRGSQSLLHVLQRAGVQVFWRDNQSGCKGVCEGLPNETVSAATAPRLCQGEHCLDEALLQGLDGIAQGLPAGDQLLVLHQLGNHGPAYDRRYPDAFRRFTPVCQTSDLRLCSREQIVNAYDNALLYTDHVLAQAIAWLRQDSTAHDTALIYVSDHGESLGDNGLYLHGVPQAIAPAVQTQVPMVVWLSQGLVKQQGIDLACLRQRSTQAASHDNLFHSLLGLMGVGTALYERSLDVLADCRH
jgi:lipid A ethanolaminephosphotransferase